MRFSIALVSLAGASASCNPTAGSAPVPPEPSAATVASSAAPPATWHFAVDAASTTHVELTSASQHIVGGTTAAMGSFDVVPTDLAKSRGAVMVDLSSFATSTFGNADDAKQTKNAAAWLQVASTSDESFRWASFAIRSIDGLGAADLTGVAPTKDGAHDVRTVTMTLHGDLLVHGHKEQRDADVAVSFEYPIGAPPDTRPARVDLVSRRPVTVDLNAIDLQPRDAKTGKVVAWTTAWRAAVAPSASVTVKLSASPSP